MRRMEKKAKHYKPHVDPRGPPVELIKRTLQHGEKYGKIQKKSQKYQKNWIFWIWDHGSAAFLWRIRIWARFWLIPIKNRSKNQFFEKKNPKLLGIDWGWFSPKKNSIKKIIFFNYFWWEPIKTELGTGFSVKNAADPWSQIQKTSLFLYFSLLRGPWGPPKFNQTFFFTCFW